MPSKVVASRRTKAAPPRPYHHGDLPSALLEAAERVLRRDGVDALTLRAVAREAGVSHTAPQHHFDDLTGLLSELAAIGFARFRDTMLAAARDASDARTRGRAMGRGYLRFAQENPGLFLLMFRSARLDMQRPALQEAADSAFAVLAGERGVAAPQDGLTLPQAAAITGTWAFVHGLAFLAIDKRLTGILNALPKAVTEDDLLATTLDGILARMAPAPVSTAKERA